MYDVAIIGGGPAGISAALTALHRNKSCVIISSAPEDSMLFKAELIDNYPGLPAITGADMLRSFIAHAKASGAEFLDGRATSVMPYGTSFGVAVGNDFVEAKALVLGIGASRAKGFPGEKEFIGYGVSYCATCDGMLYRNKKVAVVALSSDAEEEAEFLRSNGCEVEYFDSKRAKKFEITGESRVEHIVADGVSYPVSAVFIFRPSIAPDTLIPDLGLDGSKIVVDADMATNIPGVFAAGDCIGAPYQISKACGDGNVAGISASRYVEALAKPAEV